MVGGSQEAWLVLGPVVAEVCMSTTASFLSLSH